MTFLRKFAPLYRFLPVLVVVAVLSGSALGFPRGTGSSHFFSPPSVTHQVFQFVDWKYVDPERAKPEKLLGGAFRNLETRFPEILIDWNRESGEVLIRVDEERKVFTIAKGYGYNEAASLIEEVIAFVAPRVDEEGEEDLMRYMVLNGALAELDPHSNVFSQKHYKDFKVRTSGSFGGIGFTFGVQEGDLTIISPIPDTPADRAGLKSGDRIEFIDGEPTTNMGTDTAVGKMRGEPGTEVTLTIGREGWNDPRDFRITREIIHIISVEEHVLSGDGETPVLYVTIKNFQENTSEELRKAIEKADSDEVAGIVIDLRNNPGGLLTQAIDISDGFLDDGVIVSTRSRDMKDSRRLAGSDDKPFSTKPLVLLINRGSASASEIVAGALQDSRSLVIGQTSFGKGSVQQAYQLMDGGGLLLTVSQYLTPGDVSIQSIGIQPDIVVEPVEVSKGKLRIGPVAVHSGESSLANAFSEWGNSHRSSESRIEYLRPVVEEEKDDGFKAPREEEKLAELRKQFELRLARKILGAVKKGSAAREDLLTAAREVIGELDGSEKELIGKAMAEVGVDWSKSPSSQAGEPQLTLSFPKDFSLAAGGEAHLVLKVKNEGSLPAFQVWGDTESENPLLKNIDFAFGLLGPGEERTWTADVDVPKSADTRWDKVTVNLKSGNSGKTVVFNGGVLTTSMPLPEFSYTYTLDDTNDEDPARSGNGILEKGERARLLVKVRNDGGGPSAKVEVNLHSVDGQNLYLDEVRQRLEGIPKGESREVPLSFKLLEPKEDGKIEVRITINDREHGTFFSDTLEFDTSKPYPRVQSRIPPRFVLDREPPSRTSEEKMSISLGVTDDEEVKEVYAYSGEKKVYYSRNRDRGASFPVEIEVPLEEGSNRVVVFARDQKNIVSQKVFFVNRSSSGDTVSEASAKP